MSDLHLIMLLFLCAKTGRWSSNNAVVEVHNIRDILFAISDGSAFNIITVGAGILSLPQQKETQKIYLNYSCSLSSFPPPV